MGGLCALAVGLARCDPRRQGASGRAVPSWPGCGWLSSAGTLGVGPGRVSEAVRGPSVKTSGDDGLSWDQEAVTGVRGLALLRSATWAGGPAAPAGAGLIGGGWP